LEQARAAKDLRDFVAFSWIFAGLSLPIGLIPWMQRGQARSPRMAEFSEDSTELDRLAEAIDQAAVPVVHSGEPPAISSLDLVATIAHVLDVAHPHTASHSRRVSSYATAIAATMGLSPDEIETIRWGALLHDIGKIGIPDAVLLKNGRLTPEEYQIIQQHPLIGKKILEYSVHLQKYLPIVELHHEDMDGGGYPHGLKGYEVPLAVRIVKVADMFDALTSDRAYRLAMSPAQACEVLMSHAGAQLDPAVVRAFLTTFEVAIRNEVGPCYPWRDRSWPDSRATVSLPNSALPSRLSTAPRRTVLE
jgi:putative nucleotidyltransferase with HDIG domain